MPKLLRDLRINEISAVDKGAGEGVQIVLMKREESNNEPTAETNPSEPIDKGGNTPGNGSKPYGNVTYADPGYQSDGKKRYPIDTEEHIRAAWNYINKPKNGKKYSAKDLAAIKRKIIAAWKKVVGGDGPPSAGDKAGDKAKKKIGKLFELSNIILTALDQIDIVAKDGASDFNSTLNAGEAFEYAEGMMEEICESVCALRQSIDSIMGDPDLDDKAGAMETTFQQFKDHIQGVVPEWVENALAAGVLAANSPAGETGMAEPQIAKADLDAANAKIAELTKQLEESEAARKRWHKRFDAVMKMSQAHRDYFNHADQDMDEDQKKAFTDMSAEQRDKYIADNPIAAKTQKRLDQLPEAVRKQLERAAALEIDYAKRIETEETATFAKRAETLHLSGEGIGSHLRAVAKAAPEAWNVIEAAIAGLVEKIVAVERQAEAAGMYREIGKNHPPNSTVSGAGTGTMTAMQGLLAKADELRAANPKLSKAQAMAKAYEQNPDLAMQEKRERGVV